LIFYCMMIAKGIIDMIWAAAGMRLFNGYSGLNDVLARGEAALVVSEALHLLLGSVFGTIAVLGVIILPITSGDTSFRSARMIIDEYLNYCLCNMLVCEIVAIPLFIVSFGLTQEDFTVL